MSDVHRALTQIAEIHAQLGRTTVYRGWRSAPVALSGLVGLAAAAWQTAAPPRAPEAFVADWLVVGVVALVVGCVEIAWHYVSHADDRERSRARLVVGQLLPALVAGALTTGALLRIDPGLAVLLPGLWALFFGVGIFATRPYTPRGSGWIALYYWAAGVALLWGARAHPALSPWSVGGTFGAGQAAAAVVLYLQLERPFRRPASGADTGDTAPPAAAGRDAREDSK